MTKRELEARYEIRLENYLKQVQIDSRIMGDLALNHIIPTAVAYQNKLIANVKGLKDIGIETESTKTMIEAIKTVSHHISQIQTLVNEMVEARKIANKIEDNREKAIMYDEKVKAFFEPIRYSVDKLELIVDDEDWPLAKYRELLMIR